MAVNLEGGACLIPLNILAIEDDSDREFMIDIYTELHPLMKSTACQIVKDDAIAEDIIHDTIIDLIRKLDNIRNYERRRLASYIKRAVRNHSLDYCRRKKLEGNQTLWSFEDDSATPIPDDSNSPAEAFEISEEYESMGRALKRLPEREKHLLHLKYDMQYDDEAIGQIMGIKKDSVRQYLTRARRLAKENYLRGEADE
jgi:RNA polymerase sigma-70 factor (ECF subfamily)